MKEDKMLFVQSCDSRECRKKFKNQLSDLCDAITTVHTFDRKTKEITCTECGKSYKIN